VAFYIRVSYTVYIEYLKVPRSTLDIVVYVDILFISPCLVIDKLNLADYTILLMWKTCILTEQTLQTSFLHFFLVLLINKKDARAVTN